MPNHVYMCMRAFDFKSTIFILFFYNVIFASLDESRGGTTLKAGCSVEQSDFLKNQRKFFFYIDVLNLNKIVNTLK